MVKKTLRPEGLSYSKNNAPGISRGRSEEKCELVDYVVNWPRRISRTQSASIPQISSARVPGSGVGTMNSCTWQVSVNGPTLVTISKLLRLIAP